MTTAAVSTAAARVCRSRLLWSTCTRTCCSFPNRSSPPISDHARSGCCVRRWNSNNPYSRNYPNTSNNNDNVVEDHPNVDQHDDVTNHLSQIHGISDPWLHSAIVRALEPAYGKPLTVAHLQSFGSQALQALVDSIVIQQQQQQQQTTNSMANDHNDSSLLLTTPLTISVPHWGNDYKEVLEWKEGISLLQVCQSHQDLHECMEGTCGGNMSCCTCHVYLSQPLFDALAAPRANGDCSISDAELDMLDLAFEVRETSRLACQVYLTKEVVNNVSPDEVVVTIPSEVNNLWA